jgi:hypothetical protein
MKARARLQASTADVATRRAVRRTEMPHRALMIARFGGKAAHVPVFIGPAVAQSLQRRQAQGAAVDGVIFLPTERVASDLVAHELAHAMQQPDAGLQEAAPTMLLDRLAHAPVLPEHSRAERAADLVADGAAPVDSAAAALPPGVVALRRTTPGADTASPPVATRTEEPTRAAPAPAAAAAGPSAEAATPAGSAAADSDIAPTFTPPEFAEPTLDPAVAAARAAEAAAAEEAMQAAESPAAVMDAYSGMAPSQKAVAMGGLQGRLEGSNTAAHAKLVEATPAVSVETRGEDQALPLPAPISVPTDAPDITPADAAAPTIDVPAAPTQPVLSVPPNFNHEMERHFTESATPERVSDQLDAVSTSNPGVQTAIDDRAAVPRDGTNDPERLNEAQQQQREAASAQRQEAANAIVNGPGPETIMPRALDAEAPAPAMAAATPTGITPAPEAAQLQQLALPETVVADFDAATGADMAASTAAARDKMVQAETDRQTAHDTAVTNAETQRTEAERQADTDQRNAVTSQRQVIQDERQRTVNDQNSAMAEVNGQATQARNAKRTEAETEVQNTQTAIDGRYDQAETDAQAEVTRGEREAAEERERKRRESENQSWWEKAAAWIADAFDALVSFVNRIFDAVRSAVTGLIDLARRAVTGLIELASRALQALVSALGDILKGLIDGLIGQIFPELAARLNAAIDSAVTFVNERIDAVANALIEGVNRIAAALTNAVNALLDVFQGAFNAAAAILQAAISGDWGALLRQVLDAVLRVLGIDPAAFHAMIAQATDAISIIVNDPGQFVGNMIDALIGGVQNFADHFGTHLRRGVIGWLTGALGDITIPDEWNLWTVLDLVRQIMGLTWDFVRERAARVIGPENVARLEMMASWIGTLITEGWQGLWNRVQESLASLRDSVLESIRNFLLERVVMASITWLASLFNPVGALVKLVMTIWNIYQFVSAQLQRLMGIAQAVVGMISNIAHGVLDPAKQRVEEVLGNLVPVVIDLLMSLLGVTGVAARVRQIIHDLRQSIANAVDRMIERVLVTLGLRRGAGGPEAATAGAPGAAGAAAGQIGHPVLIDVAQGEDHTLSIDRTGPGGATVMLRSEPRPLAAWLDTLTTTANAETDQAKKTLTLQKIGEARGLLARLDPLADAAASTTVAPTTTATSARPAGGTAGRGRPAPTPTAPTGTAGSGSGGGDVTSVQDQLGPVIKVIFDNLHGVSGGAGGEVRQDALSAVQRALAQGHFNSLQGVQRAVAGVKTEFSPRGLTRLEIVGHGATAELSAYASPPQTVTVRLNEVFSAPALQPDQDRFKEIAAIFQGEGRGSETIAVASVDGIVVASANNAERHAESELLRSAGWQTALARADGLAQQNGSADLVISLNRSPCKSVCTTVLSNWLGTNAARHPNVRFVLAVTGRYSPSTTKEDMLVQIVEVLSETGHELTVPFSVLMSTYSRAEVETLFRTHVGPLMNAATLHQDEITDQSDLGRLSSSGWQLRQLQAVASQTPARGALAAMIGRLGQDLGSALRVTT